MSSTIRVRVPASTSNLGPGFDLLGLALGLWLEVEARVEGEQHEFVRCMGTASEWPLGDNLVTRAFDHASHALNLAPTALRLSVTSEIPIGRGLGSSGAAVAAGITLAATLAGRERPDGEDLCAIGCSLEGHPDNSTASLRGGCTLALPVGEDLTVVDHPIDASVGFAVAWPVRGTSTEEARAVLPESVPFADAVENPRRLAILLEGLRTGDPTLLSLGLEDRLHTAHRLALIEGGAKALAAALAAGAYGATVSGSGSTLIALGPKEQTTAIAAAMASELELPDGPAQARSLQPVFGPPRVERIQ